MITEGKTLEFKKKKKEILISLRYQWRRKVENPVVKENQEIEMVFRWIM